MVYNSAIEHDDLYQSKQPLPSPSSSNISNEKTIIPTKDNNVLNLLRKLPDITFGIVKSNPIIKVPNNLKPIKIHSRDITTSEITLKKTVLSKKQNINKIIDKNAIIIDLVKNNSYFTTTQSKKQKQIDNNIPLIRNNVDNIIKQNPKANSKKYIYVQKKNKQILKKKLTASKNVINVKSTGLSKTCIIPQDVKTISNNDNDLTIYNKSAIQLNNDSVNEHYMGWNSSTNGQINIVPAFPSLDFINLNHEYDCFRITKSSKNNNSIYTKASQSYIEKRSLIGQEVTQFNSTNEFNTIKYKINVDNKEKSNCYNENETLLQNNIRCHTVDLSIELTDKLFLQKMRSLFCDNLIGKTFKNKNTIEAIPNNINGLQI